MSKLILDVGLEKFCEAVRCLFDLGACNFPVGLRQLGL